MINNNQKPSGLIVLSGGMDSVTLLYDKKEEIALAVSYNYGSKHNAKEIPFAQAHCQKLGIKHITIDLDFMNVYFKSSLLQSGEEIPMGRYDAENMSSTVVPFRNGIMLSIAAGLAESHQLDKLFIANHFGDHAIYPDCRASFINPMTEAITNGTGNGVRIEAPYTSISKGEIAAIGARLGIDYAETWSCYCGDDIHCGTCGTCIERKEAMQQAGIDDPTPYKH